MVSGQAATCETFLPAILCAKEATRPSGVLELTPEIAEAAAASRSSLAREAASTVDRVERRREGDERACMAAHATVHMHMHLRECMHDCLAARHMHMFMCMHMCMCMLHVHVACACHVHVCMCMLHVHVHVHVACACLVHVCMCMCMLYVHVHVHVHVACACHVHVHVHVHVCVHGCTY